MRFRSPAIVGLLLGAGLLAACGGGDDDKSSAPEYYTSVAPILADNCVSCHSPGGVAPFGLDSFEEVVAWGPSVAAATHARTMPPWLADNSGACHTWKDARWLDQKEIDTIGAWVDAGMPAGDSSQQPPPPPPPASLAQVDVLFDMGVEYTPTAANQSGQDDYRCFVGDPGLTANEYVTAFEVRPGEPSVVHHVLLFAPIDDQASLDAEALDIAEPGPGYTCFGGAGVPAALVAAWAPGGGASFYPPGTGIQLTAGRNLVMQVHYHLDNGTLPDRTTIELDTEPFVANPAIITGIADLDLALPPGQTLVETSFEMTLPPNIPPLEVHGVFPHMHNLGRSLKVEQTSGSNPGCMANVPRWDFEWQLGYFYENTLIAQPGDTLKITCGYDTTSRSEFTYWGEGTNDEMCLSFFYVTLAPGADTPSTLPVVPEDFVSHM